MVTVAEETDGACRYIVFVSVFVFLSVFVSVFVFVFVSVFLLSNLVW